MIKTVSQVTITQDEVANEMLWLAQHRVADVLKVKVRDVKIQWKSRYVPELSIRRDAAPDITEKLLRETLKTVWDVELRAECALRLAGTGEMRSDTPKAQEIARTRSEKEKAPQEESAPAKGFGSYDKGA
jgi:hypothetical protein